MLILHAGKVPIVVPRLRRFGEHVDNNQLYFTKKLEEQARIIAIYDIEEIEETIRNYDGRLNELGQRATQKMGPKERLSDFVKAFEAICLKLAGK